MTGNPPEPCQLTDPQYIMAIGAVSYPVILRDGNETKTARALERKGYGAVEKGGSGQLIFRLSQAGADMLDPQWFYDDEIGE
jgi:DhnA family fructose-bisphosphate aldolase class Ia